MENKTKELMLEEARLELEHMPSREKELRDRINYLNKEIQKDLSPNMEAIRETLKIQKDNTISANEGAVGMYNGLELALSYMEEREPKFMKFKGNKQ